LLELPNGTQSNVNIINTAYIIKEIVDYKVIARSKGATLSTFILPEAYNDLNGDVNWSDDSYLGINDFLEFNLNIKEGSATHSITLRNSENSDYFSNYICYLITEYTIN
jgi:hypothetical protein